MTIEKDYTDFDVIKQAIQEGMSPFKPGDLEIVVFRAFGGHVITVGLPDQPNKPWARVVIDDTHLIKASPIPENALAFAADELFSHFRKRQLVPEEHNELGEN